MLSCSITISFFLTIYLYSDIVESKEAMVVIVYHGSERIIKQPVFHDGKKTNDYGYGFYTTESLEQVVMLTDMNWIWMGFAS